MRNSTPLDDTAFTARLGELKQDLVEYVTAGKLAREFRAYLERHLDGRELESQEQLYDLVDTFAFDHRLDDGSRPVERFAKQAAGLSDDERAALRAWAEPRIGVLEVLERDDVAFRLYNLVNEVEYRVIPNVPMAQLEVLRPGMFVVTTLLPVRDFFTFSGTQRALRRSEAEAARAIARQMAFQIPSAAFRDNPARLERAWKLQREQHDEFVEFFGADEVVVAGREASPRWEEFLQWGRRRRLAAAPPDAPVPPAPPAFPMPTDVDRAATVGLVSDPEEGTGFLVEYGAFVDACRDPHAPGRILLEYLAAPSVSPKIFQRAADRYPDTFSLAMAGALDRPGFDAKRDLEPLLRERKPRHFERPALPGIIPIDLGARPRAAGSRWRPAEGEPLPAPNDPCPCGSGKKFKKCCRPR